MLLNGQAIVDASRGFTAMFITGMKKAKPLSPRLTFKVESLGAEEELQFEGELPQFREWIGERQRKNFKIYAQSLRSKTWELTIAVKREYYEDDRLGAVKRKFSRAGIQAVAHKDNQLGTLLTNAFTANCFDGTPFVGTTHPRLDGTTQSNRVTGALNSTRFNTAIQNMRTLTDDQGEKLEMWDMGGTLALIVAPNLESTARALLLAEQGASGASNTDFGRAELIVFNRLPNDHWFLVMVDSEMPPFVEIERTAVELVVFDKPDDNCVFERNEVEHGARYRGVLGYGWWQAIQGSNGS